VPTALGAGGETPGGRLAEGNALAWRCSAVPEGWIPTIVDFRAAIGRICGALARGKPEPDGRTEGGIGPERRMAGG
jgi:hypothetical protein